MTISFRRFFSSNAAILIVMALFKLALHLVTNNQYGFNRDELYYIACSQHLDLGYVDHPALIAFLAFLIRMILGESLFALRFLPAVAGASMVFLTGLMVRQLGGGRFAQIVACLALIIAPLYLSMNTLFTTNVFDELLWLLCSYMFLLFFRSNNPKYFLLIGLTMGIGLLNKHSTLIFCMAAVIGLLFTQYRKYFLNKYFWLGAIMALAIFSPNIFWQISHGWPTLEFLKESAINRMPEVSPLGFLGQQILSLNPVNLPVEILGLYFFLFCPKGKRYRAFGWIFLFVATFFAFQRSKDYYLAPAYPIIWAGGAYMLEYMVRSKNWNWLRAAIVIVMVIAGLVVAPFCIPILPVQVLDRYASLQGASFPAVFSDMLGWEKLTATVAEAYNTLSPSEKAKCAVLANNYGEAAAIDYYGSKYGLPRSISTHNSYWLWGPRNYTGEIVLSVGVSMEDLRQGFNSVRQIATVNNDHVMWYETNLPVLIWTKPKIPFQRMWPYIKLFY
jgi:4-amino-4-deoxy-L-arabinose transferase-like glycosyltransferase